jgi:hypothetical protein
LQAVLKTRGLAEFLFCTEDFALATVVSEKANVVTKTMTARSLSDKQGTLY